MQRPIDTSEGEDGTNLPESGSLRERKHEFVLQEIERASWDLFSVVGFERATVAEISRRAGISRRTFFRYFRSKEDLLAYSVAQCGRRIAERMAAEPARWPPLLALERAMISVMQEEVRELRRPKEMIGLMLVEPSLRARFLYHLDGWVKLLSDELIRRKAYSGNRGRCELAAALYCTAFDRAHLRWHTEPGTDLLVLLRGAFRQLGMKGPRSRSR